MDNVKVEIKFIIGIIIPTYLVIENFCEETCTWKTVYSLWKLCPQPHGTRGGLRAKNPPQKGHVPSGTNNGLMIKMLILT